MNYPTIYRNNQLNGGLNGLLGRWIKKAINYVINVAASTLNNATGSFLADTIDAWKFELKGLVDNATSGSFFYRGSFITTTPTSIEPTSSEELILDNWMQNKFTGYLKNMLIDLSSAIASNSIPGVNRIMSKMCIIRKYYQLNELEGLSQNAVNVRLELINQLFSALENQIISNFGATSSISITASQSDFNGLFTNSVQNQRYDCSQYLSKNLIENPIKFSPGQTTLPVLPSAPGATNNQSGSTEASSTKSTIFTFQNFLLTSSLLVTIYQLTRKEEPK